MARDNERAGSLKLLLADRVVDGTGRPAIHRGFVAVPLSFEPGVRAEITTPSELRAWLTA